MDWFHVTLKKKKKNYIKKRKYILQAEIEILFRAVSGPLSGLDALFKTYNLLAALAPKY